MDTPDSNVSPPNSAIPPPQSQTTTPNEPAEDTTEKTLDETSTAEEDPIRKRLKDETLRRTNKEITPRGWQLDVAMALIEGKDAVVVAGTGEGKTLAFTLPLFNRTQYQKNRIMLVISPLNMLEADQRESFKKLGLKAVVINHETYHDGMEEIQAGGCDIILTSPEMCLTSERFRTFLSDPKFGAQIMMIVVDEAHCIVNWGKSFRKTYRELGNLRALIPNPVPVLATSATLTPDDITIVRDVMLIDAAKSYFINLGNDRPNISYEVAIMPSTTTDYSALYELLVDRSTGEERLRRTIIFLDDREEAMAACRQIREDCPPHLKELCDFLHAMRGEGTKIRVFRDFKTGKIYVLVATEAAGMGCDIRDIELVIQWGVCSDLATWLQRAGRAGRDPTIKARAIMFVPASTFHERAPAEGGKESTKDQRKAKEL
ncbi:P-loop containing nucleoside triphosphate hydrolase protein, partial [Sistotremastrum suecicum HHB10207 ss-3]